jgi:hypothetical protein
MRQSLRLLGIVAGCCTLVLYVAGCGVTTTSGVAGNSPLVQSTRAPSSTPIPGQITSIPSGTSVPGQSTTTPAPGPTPAPGEITITVEHYAPTATITTSIHNGSPAPIYVANHQTSCTIVSLQMVENSGWTTIGACRLMTVTGIIKIAAGATTTVQMTSTPWPAGTYRAKLSFGTSPMTTGPVFSSPVYSADFTVS